jgi:hypothetical protein
VEKSKRAGTVHSYRICGLSVASDVALPGLIAGTPESSPQVTIRHGAVPEALPSANLIGPTWQIAGQQFLLSVPNVARFLLRNGDQIVFAPYSEASLDDVPIFLIGTVFGILLHQRQQIVLHASAVEVNGKAVIFCGPSGEGKSTLAAALARLGYRLLADDVCAITFRANSDPVVHPDGRHLKLWAQAIEKLELEDVRGGRVRNHLEKFYVQPPEVTVEAVPLGAVYSLREARPSDIPGIARPNIVDATLLLRGNAYRPLLVTRLEQKAQYFRAAAKIASKSGVFRLTRPGDFAVMPEVVCWLERHWRDLGVTELAA